MLEYDQFIKRYNFNEGGDALSQGNFGALYEAIDTYTQRPVLVKVSRPDNQDYIEYPDDLFAKQGPLLRCIKKVFSGWLTHIVGANSNQSPKIEGLAMKLEKGPAKGKGPSIAVKSYMAFERMEASVKKYHLDPDPRLRMTISEYEDLAKTLVELLAFFEEERIVHGDMNPLNLMYASDWDIKLVDFGIGKLLDEDLVQPIRFQRTLLYCHPMFDKVNQSNDMEDMRQNDKFCAGMVLIQLGSFCKTEDLQIVKQATQISLSELREKAEFLFNDIEERYDKRYVTIIERLLTNDKMENIMKFIQTKGGQIGLDECELWWDTVIVPNCAWIELRIKENSTNFRKYRCHETR